MATDIKKTFLTAFRGVLQATITSSDICYYLQIVVFVFVNNFSSIFADYSFSSRSKFFNEFVDVNCLPILLKVRRLVSSSFKQFV